MALLAGIELPLEDPILIFTLLALVMLAAPLLAERLRIPDLVLLLLAGAALGPNGLGVLTRSSAVTLFGAVGLLYIMFLAGLEIDLQRFARSQGRSIVFGLLTFAIPQGLGTLVGRYVLGMEWPTAILMASMFASHTLLAYPIASRLGISRSEPVAVTVGATIITDTLALLVLAVIADSARGIDLGTSFWVGVVLGMAALVALTWWGIPRLAGWFFRNVTEQGGAQFLFVLVTTCGFAYLSHFARMEPIIGAFLAGAAFNRLIPEHSPLMNRVVFAGNTLFIPFFLISVGMLVDPRALINDPDSWLIGVSMVILVIVTKYLAAMIAQRMFGYSRAAGQVMFGLSVVQAAATLAAALVGFQLEILNASVLNGAIAMIMATCPLGAWIVERRGRELQEVEAVPLEPVATEQRLLVAVSNPELAIKLLDMAFLLRDQLQPGGIYPLTVVREQQGSDDALARGEKLLGHCLAHAAAADIVVHPELREAVNVSDGLLHTVRELRVSSVLAGWSGRPSAGTRIFGNVMFNLVHSCAARLLFCRIVQPLNTTKRLVVVFPPLAERRQDISTLMAEAKRLAQAVGAELQAYLCAPAAADLQRRLEETRPDCRLTLIEARSWSEARRRLFADLGAGDMVLAPAERWGGGMWTPGLDQLPGLLAERFPSLNLLVVYPPLPVSDERIPPAMETMDTRGPVLIPVDLPDGINLEDALYDMTRRAFPEEPATARAAVPLLLASAESYAVELAAGAVLLHGHCGQLERAVLMVGYSRNGWQFPQLPTPARMILALLSPQAQAAELHLQTLAYVAERFHDARLAKRMGNAGSAEEICAVFQAEA